MAADQTPEAGLAVTFAASGITVSWDPAFDSILEFAEAKGLSPGFGCRAGYCHTCMCPLVEGEVHYAEEPPLAPDPGHVLICCSTPRTAVTIDV